MEPPTELPAFGGRKWRIEVSVISRTARCLRAEMSVALRKAGFDDVGRVSGGKYHAFAQFHPMPLRLNTRSSPSQKALVRMTGSSAGFKELA